MAERDIEEILEELWIAEEERRKADRRTLGSSQPQHPPLLAWDMPQALKRASEQGLLTMDSDSVVLTAEGRELARSIVRRHRLAERLLVDILDLGKEETESRACEFEHLLSPGAESSICILLGHPTTCPHGKQIPAGRCCQQKATSIRPLVVPATQLNVGEEGTVAYFSSMLGKKVGRLAALGILPGDSVKLIQRQPSYVFRIGETELALDGELVQEIYVRRSEKGEGGAQAAGPRKGWGWGRKRW